ncbi:uncharacterized protein [Typha angustifolia]|uniref:uncharacterized protein n=1 Tax=Typha angustifolia TaxID=59011 RepID=UPI003C2F2EE3
MLILARRIITYLRNAWRRLLHVLRPPSCRVSGPMLVGKQRNQAGNCNIYTFFSVSDDSLVPNVRAVHMNVLRIVGCCRGWLAMFDPRNPRASLLLWNPVSDDRIYLPSRYSGPHGRKIKWKDLEKFVLSDDPEPAGEWVAVAYLTNKNDFLLAFYRNGDPGWTILSILKHNDLLDIEYYNGRFFVATPFELFRCDLELPIPALIKIKLTNQPDSMDEKKDGSFRSDDVHLVRCSEDLLEILLVREKNQYVSRFAEVYKLEWGEFQVTLKRQTSVDVGEFAFFVGSTHSFSLAARDCPSCRSASVYISNYTYERNWLRVIDLYHESNLSGPMECPDGLLGTEWRPTCWISPGRAVMNMVEE